MRSLNIFFAVATVLLAGILSFSWRDAERAKAAALVLEVAVDSLSVVADSAHEARLRAEEVADSVLVEYDSALVAHASETRRISAALDAATEQVVVARADVDSILVVLPISVREPLELAIRLEREAFTEQLALATEAVEVETGLRLNAEAALRAQAELNAALTVENGSLATELRAQQELTAYWQAAYRPETDLFGFIPGGKTGAAIAGIAAGLAVVFVLK